MRVLMACSDARIRDAFMDALHRAGIGVVPVADAAATLELARQQRPDIVQLDDELPGIGDVGGPQKLAAEIPDSEVVVLAGRFDRGTGLRAVLAGAAGYISRGIAAEAFVDALLPTMFSKTMPREAIDDYCAGMQAFHPRGFRAIAWASAEDVRDVLPRIDVPTLLVYGDRDVRAPLTVARDLRAAISGSRLVVLPDAGHVCNVEAPDEFNAAVRDFLRDTRSQAQANY
jgi:pimeloyl-ACP methyl ester carboxylesterase